MEPGTTPHTLFVARTLLTGFDDDDDEEDQAEAEDPEKTKTLLQDMAFTALEQAHGLRKQVKTLEKHM
jgi:hypothetical protein